MARLVKPLTATQVSNAKPRASMYKMFDGGGLFLQVNPSGGKHWKMKYCKDSGKEGLLTFGAYPAVSLEQARKKREEARAQKAAGIDPGEAKRKEQTERQQRAKDTFEAVARTWMDVHATKVKPHTLNGLRHLLERFMFPLIGSVPIRNLQTREFLDALRKVEEQQAGTAARRSSQACNMVMRYAVATGQADNNPLPSLRGCLKSIRTTHYPAPTEPALVGRLLRTIYGYPGTFVITSALKIAAYIFVRPGELQQAKWADINFDSCEWRYIATKTETPHIVPLAPQVMAILRDLHTFTGQCEWVFQNQYTKNKPISKSSLHAAMRAMGIGADEMTPHGFRAIARTLLDEVLGERYDFIEQQLAHKVRDPNGRAYNRTVHLAERKRMMCRWADYLDSLRDQVA